MQRYFARKLVSDQFILNDEDTYHAVKVMRSKIDTKIEIVYDNKLYLGVIKNIENNVSGIIIEKLEGKKPLFNVTIAQALVKEQKFDLILQKSVELGASGFIPLRTTRSVVKINEDHSKKIIRWQKIINEAAAQSKRIDIPKILNISNINELCKMDYKYKFLCSVNENAKTIKMVLQNISICDKILFVIGPEGGFSLDEENLMMDHGFIRITLGDLVLRTETASLAILSMINYHFMR